MEENGIKKRNVAQHQLMFESVLEQVFKKNYFKVNQFPIKKYYYSQMK